LQRLKRPSSLHGNVGENAHDVALFHHQEILAVEHDFGARPLAEQHAVADLEVDRDQLAGFVTAARTDGGDFALRGLFLGAVQSQIRYDVEAELNARCRAQARHQLY